MEKKIEELMKKYKGIIDQKTEKYRADLEAHLYMLCTLHLKAQEKKQ